MDAVVGQSGRTCSGLLRVLAMSLVVPLLLTACVNAASSPTAGATAAPTESPSAVPSDSPTEAPTATAAPNATAVPTATASPTPTVTPEPTAKGTAASAQWTGIKWTSVGPIAGLVPATPAADLSTDVNVFGWSRGYVAFGSSYDMASMDASTSNLVSSSSTDAVHWTTPKPMSVAGLTYAVEVTSVSETPSALVAIGRIVGVACGGPSTVSAMWSSLDGLTWSRVTPPADFASASVYTVDGGPSGFIAFGHLKDGLTQSLWTSSDGRTWHSKLLPKSVFGNVVVQGATSLAAGFAVSGAVESGEGCGGPQYETPSLWWSADGGAWTRATLTGAAPATNSTISVTRINSRTYMAVANQWDEATQAVTTKVWVTSDGRTWKVVPSPAPMLVATIITDGRQGLAISTAPTDPVSPVTPLMVATVDDDLSVRVLTQTGDMPTVEESVNAWNTTLGPAGLVVVGMDTHSLWLGEPVR